MKATSLKVRMNKFFKWMPLVAMVSIILVGCGNKKQQSTVEEEVDNFLEMAFAEPDTYFEDALRNFEDGDMESAAESLNDAIFFVRGLTFEDDTVNAPILEFAATDLEDLQNDLLEGNVNSSEVLTNAFASTNTSIATYHLAIVDDYFRNGGENKEGLERLHRALIRFDNAVAYQSYELSDEEQTEVEAIRKIIAEAEKSSPKLWDRVNAFLMKVEKKFKIEDSETKQGQ